MNARTSGLGLELDADLASLTAVRNHISATAADLGADADVSDRLRLIASELVTNAIQHGNGQRIEVRLTRSHRWELDVTGADLLDELPTGSFPSGDRISGRGLAIVAALSDGVELVDVDGQRIVRCSISGVR